MSKESLQKLTVSQLLEIAKAKEIKGRHKMKKEDLIEEIIKSENVSSISDDSNINKKKYLDTISPGVLLAFKLPDGSVKSAKVVKRSTKDRKLKLITEYKAEFIISYEDVIWVKTGKRWPKGVYLLLKGKSNEQTTVS